MKKIWRYEFVIWFLVGFLLACFAYRTLTFHWAITTIGLVVALYALSVMRVIQADQEFAHPDTAAEGIAMGLASIIVAAVACTGALSYVLASTIASLL